jgi:LuxR family maltose regulon positive regulatory protein
MSIPLLETKLYAPRTTGRLVPRPRLATRLQADAMPRLLLVSAPAGFGKSTMLAQLLDGRHSTAWLSLDPGDNEPVTF